MSNKIKVLIASDHLLSPSGVGTQAKIVASALLNSGKFSIVQLGGAIKHSNYQTMKTHEYGDDLIIVPVDGLGNKETVRSILRTERPDIVWLMTDPRFFYWLWEMENEIRALAPLAYYHVWDNFPTPTFNKKFYDSNDVVVTISKLTDKIVEELCPNLERHYIPHVVDPKVFKPMDVDEIKKFKTETLKQSAGKKVYFWNSRNARRKNSASVIFWFKKFLDEVGRDQAMLLMHTDPKDENGSDLEACINFLGLTNGEVKFSREKLPTESLAMLYNMSHCTLNSSNAEGFGCSTLESLACGVPIIVPMTGGLQDQVTDGNNWAGIGIPPASRTVIGSQQIPWIYEDNISGDDFVKALLDMHNMPDEERAAMIQNGLNHINENFNFEKRSQQWVDLMLNIHEQRGSWENRKMYKSWTNIKF